MKPPDPEEKPYPAIRPIRSASFFVILKSLIPWIQGPLWRLAAPWEFEVPGYGKYVIPAGYEFDKASVPPIFWLFGYTPDGPCEAPALQHDFLCDLLSGGSEWLRSRLGELPPCPPAEVIHSSFARWMFECGERPKKAYAMGEMVRRFGPGGFWRPSTILRKMFGKPQNPHKT